MHPPREPGQSGCCLFSERAVQRLQPHISREGGNALSQMKALQGEGSVKEAMSHVTNPANEISN